MISRRDVVAAGAVGGLVTTATNLQVLEVFRAPQFMDISLSDWITHMPPALVAQHLNVSEATIAKVPRSRPEIMPL